MLSRLVKYLLVLGGLYLPIQVFSQCPPGPLGTGQFLNKPNGCATFGLDIDWRLFYNQLDDNAEINIDWGDGTPLTTFNVGTTGAQTGINVDMIFPHTYTEANTLGGCEYTMTAWVVSGPSNCYTVQATTVEADIVIWNTDNFGNAGAGLAIDPMEVLVCAGTTATIQLTDVSPWNCTDVATVSPAALNDLSRWVQWEYGVVNTMTGNVLVNSVNQAPYPFLGVRTEYSLLPVLAPLAPDNLSLTIDIPATALTNEEFHIRLNNWNQCNPFEDVANIPTGIPPVTRDVIIRIIDPPVAVVTATGGNGPYCIGEQVQFQYGGVNQPGFTYLWDFGDGNSSTDMDPLHTYTTSNGGVPFDVTVQVTNGNLNVNCVVQTNPPFPVTVIDAPQPVIAVEDLANQPAPLEYCVSSAPVDLLFSMDPSSTAPDPPNTTSTWNFYDVNSIVNINFTMVDNGTDIPRQFTIPGTYLVELISMDVNTMCENTVQQTIILYDDPQAAFLASQVCEGERTDFSGISDPVTSIGTVVAGDQVAFWDWDFSFDGVSFNQELRQANNADFQWFLDGNPVVGEVEPATSAAGTYMVALRLTTQFGQCTDMIVFNVTVLPVPQSTFSSNHAGAVCPDEVITFTNNSAQSAAVLAFGPVDYQLVIDDDQGSPTSFVPFPNPTLDLTFANSTAGNIVYTVNLQATAAAPNNCFVLATPANITVNPAFNAGFEDLAFDPFASNCSPLTGTFTVDAPTQALNANSYTWTIFDAAVPIAGFPVTINSGAPNFHELAYQIDNNDQSGTNYRVLLESVKAGLCIADAEEFVRVNPIPSSDFSLGEIVDDCDTKMLTLQADQSGLVDYSWTFSIPPDITDDDGDEIRVLWNRPIQGAGDLNIDANLITRNGFDCQALMTTTLNFVVESKQDDIAIGFDVSPISQTLPESTVTITNTTNDDNFSFLWDFGDSQTSNQKNPGTHTYATHGEYEITLTVGAAFCEEVTTQTVRINPTTPVVDFEIDEEKGCPPHVVNFTNLTQFAEDNRYQWDFGDGSSSTEINPAHSYAQPGFYTVTLTAGNILGEEESESKDLAIEVYQRPIASFDPRPREVFLPSPPVTMVNFSRGAETYFWDFGDGSTSEEIEPQHVFENEGDFNITLTATSAEGCSDQITIETAVTVVIGGQIRAPNAFTPNPDGPSGGNLSGAGGGLNDVFLPILQGVTEFKMQVFNRWGNLMFETVSFDVGWDGYFEGTLAPQGVYVYRLELTFQNDQREVKVGDFTLLR